MNPYLLSLFYLMVFSPAILMAQIAQPVPPAEQIQKTISPTAGTPLAPAIFVNPMTAPAGPSWNIKLSQRGGIRHAIDQENELQVLKAQKTAAKIENEAHGNTPPDDDLDADASTPITPIVLQRFEANTFDTWSPPDNHMAISDEGYIVSVINSAVSYFDMEGNTILEDESFDNFLSDLDVTTFLFDPKVLYDPVEEKFILVVLSGNVNSTSKVVVGFSVSQNPADGWWFYTFDGDYLQGSWFDYPNLGISDSDLFITGNLFSQNDGFDQSVILQIKKEEGFVGGTVDWEYFNNVENGFGEDAFTIVPASYGYNDNYGPGVFMVSNFGFNGSEIFLYEITDSVNASQELNVYTVNTSFYDAAGEALQLGTNSVLSTGGCRIRNAFYANGFVHFVFGQDYIGGYSGIRYNRLDVNNLTNQHSDFGQSQMDCAYGSVIPYGLDSTSNAVMIGYLQSGSSIYPQMSVVNVDEDMVFGEPVVVKAGVTPIAVFSGNSQRWGDYSGGGRRHNADYPNAWFVGCYGQNDEYGNWIYEVSDQANGLPPIADFEANPTSGEVPVTAFFSDLSVNGVENYTWNFEGGDPVTSSNSSSFVQYETPGIYDVELIVSNAFGADTIVKENYISAVQYPIADFEADVTVGPAPLTVNFTNLSSNFNSNNWLLTGGIPSSSSTTNPTVTYNNPGIYSAHLTIFNTFGSDSHSEISYIHVGEPVGVNDLEVVHDLKVFPNPVINEFNLEFYLDQRTLLDISIVDAAGKSIKTLLYGMVKGGQNILSFNPNVLATGTYFIVLKDEQQKVIKSEKIIVNR